MELLELDLDLLSLRRSLETDRDLPLNDGLEDLDFDRLLDLLRERERTGRLFSASDINLACSLEIGGPAVVSLTLGLPLNSGSSLPLSLLLGLAFPLFIEVSLSLGDRDLL